MKRTPEEVKWLLNNIQRKPIFGSENRQMQDYIVELCQDLLEVYDFFNPIPRINEQIINSILEELKQKEYELLEKLKVIEANIERIKND